MNPSSFIEEYGFPYQSIVDYKALLGDPSDNIKGIPGVGKVTAKKLILEYGTLENIYKHKDEITGKVGENIRENETLAKESYELSKILTDIPVKLTLDDLSKRKVDYENLIEFYKELDFHSFIKRLDVPSLDTLSMTHAFKVGKVEDLKYFIKDNISIYCEFFESNYHLSEVIGIGLSDGNKHLYVTEEVMLSSKAFMDFLRSERPKYTYDYKAFKVRLLKKGYDINGVVFDLLLAAYLDNPEIVKKNDFKVITGFYNYDDLEYDDLIYTKKQVKVLPDDKKVYREHITKKAKAISKLYLPLIEKLKINEQLSLLEDLEIPLSTV